MTTTAPSRAAESLPIRAPHPLLLAAEARVVGEIGLYLQTRPLLRLAPRGDGHPVLVLPGFTAGDISTVGLRGFLNDLGYQAHGWSLGSNFGHTPHLEARMVRRLRRLYWRFGRAVSVVGWSLGGIYARELARQQPDMVRQVVTLGSPFGASPKATNVWRLYERVSGEDIEAAQELIEQMGEPPPVPSTAVYSRTDGIVSWKACLERDSPTTENVRVPGSHCGLGFNPLALYVVADRLAQVEGEWSKFEPRGAMRLMFGSSRSVS